MQNQTEVKHSATHPPSPVQDAHTVLPSIQAVLDGAPHAQTAQPAHKLQWEQDVMVMQLGECAVPMPPRAHPIASPMKDS